MDSLNVKIHDFLKLFKINTGITGLTIEEVFKILCCTETIKSQKEISDEKLIYKQNFFNKIQNRTFLNKKADFQVNQKVYVVKKANRKAYRKRRKAVVVGVYNNYIALKYDKYTESVLYVTMEICEYLIYKRGKK